MNRPQFAERQYETAANIELAMGVASPFVPTQNLEFYLGIDAAHDPRKISAIWRILSVKIPRRISITPGLWPSLPRRFHNEISGRYASLFLQYKTPVHQDHPRAKYYRQIGSSYFQVAVTKEQQKRLRALERRVAPRALVRYAAPAFWSRTDFERHDERRQVLRNSAFIAPSIVKRHSKWMYAGPGTAAFCNPDLHQLDGEAWEGLVGLLSEVAQRQSLRDHIRMLAEDLSGDERAAELTGTVAWLDRLQQYGDFSADDLHLLADLSLVALYADSEDLDWFVMLSPDPEWVSLADLAGFGWHRWPYFLW